MGESPRGDSKSDEGRGQSFMRGVARGRNVRSRSECKDDRNSHRNHQDPVNLNVQRTVLPPHEQEC